MVTMEGGTQFGKEGQVSFVYYADVQAVATAIWVKRPLPITQPERCEIKREERRAQAETQKEQARSIWA